MTSWEGLRELSPRQQRAQKSRKICFLFYGVTPTGLPTTVTMSFSGSEMRLAWTLA